MMVGGEPTDERVTLWRCPACGARDPEQYQDATGDWDWADPPNCAWAHESVLMQPEPFVPESSLSALQARVEDLEDALARAARLLPPIHPEKGPEPEWLINERRIIAAALNAAGSENYWLNRAAAAEVREGNLREALEFYARRDLWIRNAVSLPTICEDRGEHARTALARSNDEGSANA